MLPPYCRWISWAKGLGGRPPKLTLDLKKKICKLLCLGASRRQAATILDIDHSTISHAAERDPEFGRALLRAEEFSSLGPKLAIAAAGLRDWRAAAWLIAHQQKHPLPEDPEVVHKRSLERARRTSEYLEQHDILSEQRNESEKQRAKVRKLQLKAEEQAKFEAENPHLFRRKKKKEQAGVAENADVGQG